MFLSPESGQVLVKQFPLKRHPGSGSGKIISLDCRSYFSSFSARSMRGFSSMNLTIRTWLSPREKTHKNMGFPMTEPLPRVFNFQMCPQSGSSNILITVQVSLSWYCYLLLCVQGVVAVVFSTSGFFQDFFFSFDFLQFESLFLDVFLFVCLFLHMFCSAFHEFPQWVV